MLDEQVTGQSVFGKQLDPFASMLLNRTDLAYTCKHVLAVGKGFTLIIRIQTHRRALQILLVHQRQPTLDRINLHA